MGLKDSNDKNEDPNSGNPLYAPANDASNEGNPSEGSPLPSGSGDTGGSAAPSGSGDAGGSNSNSNKAGAGSNSSGTGAEQNQPVANESQRNHPTLMDGERSRKQGFDNTAIKLHNDVKEIQDIMASTDDEEKKNECQEEIDELLVQMRMLGIASFDTMSKNKDDLNSTDSSNEKRPLESSNIDDLNDSKKRK